MKYIWLLFLALLCFSCGGKNKNVASEISDATFTITVPSKRQPLYDINEFMDSVKFIQLETTDECMIRKIHQLWFHKDKIIVADNERRAFFIFDSEGCYLSRIRRVGRGPGEYTSFSSGMFDPANETLMVYDYPNAKVVVYSLDGRFLKEISNFSDGALIWEMLGLPNGHFLGYLYENQFGNKKEAKEKYTGLWELDEKGRFVGNLLTYDTQYPVYIGHLARSYFTLKIDGTVYLSDAIHSDIYEYKEGNLVKHVDYFFEDDRLSAQAGKAEKKEDYTHSVFTHITKDYIFGQWADNDSKNFYSFYNIANKEAVFADAFDYFGSGFPLLPAVLTNTNREDVLVSNIPNGALIFWLYDKVYSLPPATRAFWEQVVEGKTENEIMDMNPILQIMYLKRQR